MHPIMLYANKHLSKNSSLRLLRTPSGPGSKQSASQRSTLPHSENRQPKIQTSIPALAMEHALDKHLELNEFLMLLDPYRVTVPALQTELGGITLLESPHTIHQARHEIDAVIRMVMSQYQITIEDIFYKEYSSVFNPDALQCHPLISIGVRVEDETKAEALDIAANSWLLAAQDLYTRLSTYRWHGEDIGCPYVEIVSREKRWVLEVEPVLRDSIGLDVKNSWEKVRPEILGMLNTTLSSDTARWSNVCVFMCPSREPIPQMSPTILVSLEYPATQNWLHGLRMIDQILSRHGITNLRVEFAYGGLKFSYPVKDNILDTSDLEKATMGGDSIGLANSKSSGSVGGCILLDDPTSADRPRLCLLTCHHNLQPKEWKYDVESFRQQFPLVAYSSQEASEKLVRSPSMEDYEETIKHLEKLATGHTDECRKLLEKNDGSPSFHSPHQTRIYNSSQNALTAIREQLAILRDQREPIGRLIASSGIRIQEDLEGNEIVQRKMDWAIVEIGDISRFNPVYAPSKYSTPSGPLDTSSDGPYNPPSSAVEETADSQNGDWVCMRGRTSGYQTGTRNLVDQDTTMDPRLGLGTFREMAIVSTRKYKQFGTSGDSGSFIYDRLGRVVAMQVTERYPTNHSESHWSGACPIGTIFKDIKRQTGATPRLCSEEEFDQIRHR